MTISPVSYANSDNSNGNGWGQTKDKSNNGRGNGRSVVPGYQKHLDKFTEIDGELIKINNKNVKFDAPPVIKDGRTLIPVRAVTEGLGGYVFWDADKRVATIISPDGDVRIDFDMSDDNGGHIYVYDAKDGEVYDLSSTEWDYRGEEVLDVLPGLNESRTYVPLRFIGEMFGLGVHYDPWTGSIEINKGPTLTPDDIEYEDEDEVPNREKIYINEKGLKFEGILGLEEGADYTTKAAIRVNLPDDAEDATLVLYLKDDAYDDFDEELYIFVLKFAGGLKDIYKDLKVTIGD